MGKNKPKTKKQKENKISVVMKEFKGNKLKSGSGKRVTSSKQAIAIALNEAGIKKKKNTKSKG